MYSENKITSSACIKVEIGQGLAFQQTFEHRMSKSISKSLNVREKEDKEINVVIKPSLAPFISITIRFQCNYQYTRYCIIIHRLRDK